MLDYQEKLKTFIEEIPGIPNEIGSGRAVLPFSDELKANFLNKDMQKTMESQYPTNELFKKYTQTSHFTLLKSWAGGGQLTTCNALVGTCGATMGAKEYLGAFELKELLASKGKGSAYIAADSGRKPNYGDIFRAESFHMGVSLGFEGDDWLTVEGGQGGPIRGYDVVKRKKQKFVPASLKGWCDMRLYLSGKPPMPDWMVGLWVIYCGSQTYHYSINQYGEAAFYPWKPIGDLQNATPTDTGTISLQGADNFTVTWSKEGGTEKFKYERFDSFPGIMEKVSGSSSRSEVLKGVRL